MRIQGSSSPAAGLILLALLSYLAPSVSGALRIWSGGGSDRLWSNPDNWGIERVGAGIPQNGDDLIFSDSAALTGIDPVQNDLTSLVVNSIWFNVVSATDTTDWTLNGN